jgi:hypothetical protein
VSKFGLLYIAIIAVLIVCLRSIVMGPGTAHAAVFPLPGGATLEFEADGLDGPLGNMVVIGDQRTTIDDDVTGSASPHPLQPIAPHRGMNTHRLPSPKHPER